MTPKPAVVTLPPMSIIAFKPEQPYVPPAPEEKEAVAAAVNEPAKEKAKAAKSEVEQKKDSAVSTPM